MKITGKIYAFVAIILLSLSPAPDARPVTVPDLNTGTFQNTDLDPTFNQADLSGSQAQWEYLVATGLNDLAAQWEAAADLEIDNQVAAITTSDAYTTTAEYRAYLRRELEMQKGEDLATWELAADIAIQDRRSAFLDELARRKREATAADRQAFEESSTLVVTSNGNPIDLEERVNRMQAGWSSLFAEDVERGLAEFGGGIAVLEQDYAQLQRTLRRQDNEYQAGMLEIQGYENQVRTAVSNSAVQLEAMLGPGGMFEEEVCDPSNNCVTQLNQAGQDLQTLLNDLKDSIVNEASLSTLARQMVTFLQAQKTQAQATAASWTAQARQTENISSTIGILFGQGASSVTLPEVAAIIAYRNSGGANDAALKNILGKNLATGLSIESISNPDVCGFGSHNPYPITVGSSNTDQCYSAAGMGAFSYSATGVGGWAGVPLIVTGTFDEQFIRFQGSYVIYDANADANATTWGDYTSDLDGFLNTWNDLLPALTNWEAQSAAYEADYAAWQTSANTALQQGAAAYEAGVTELVNERSKWVSQMENIYREGENDWLVIRKELEKKKEIYRQELENEGLNEVDLERELNRRSMEALSKMTMPSRPGARNAALETTVRAHNKFGEIKNDTLIAAERVDSSRMEEILSQFDKSINGALNTAVMETLNQAAIDSRQGMVDQMSGVLEYNLDGSVQQALHYSEALTKARAMAGITDEMFADGFDGLSKQQADILNKKLQEVFKEEKYAHDEGFSVTQNENGNIIVTRKIPTGNALLIPGMDGTKPEHYKPEMREESFMVSGPAAMKLLKTDGIFSTWDLNKVVGEFSEAATEYTSITEEGGDIEKIISATLKKQGDVLSERVSSYQDDMARQIEKMQTLKSLAESMITGGLNFEEAATNYVEGQVRGQIAGAVAEATGLPSEFISGLMGGQKPHEAVMSMAENAAWANFEQATGIEGISTLMRTHLENENARKQEKKDRQFHGEDFLSGGLTYAWRNQQHSGSMKTITQLTGMGITSSVQNAYLSARSEQGMGAFSTMLNDSLNGLVGQLTTAANILTTGNGPTQSELQTMTGLPAEFLDQLAGPIKPRTERTDIYGRLGTRNLGRWVDQVVDYGTELGQELASGKYFADAIGGDMGLDIKRRTNADFAIADDLTNAIFNPLDYMIRPMYRAVGMERTYDNFWAGYKKMTRNVREDIRDGLVKKPGLLDVTAFAAANASGCVQCYYGYAYNKGWHRGGNNGAAAEVGNIGLKALRVVGVEADVGYTYENGWDVKLGLGDPSGSLSGGVTYSDQNGAGIYVDVGPGFKPAGFNAGLELSQRGGLGLTGGYKWASGHNLGISYNTNNGFGVNGGWGGDAFDDSFMSGQGGLSFGISQRGGYNVGATLDPSKLKGFGLGLNYVNGPGDNDGVGIAARFDGKQLLNYDMSTGQFTPAKAGALADTFIKEMLAAEQKAKLLRKHLLKANEQLGRSDFTNVLAVLGGNPELLAITRDGEISESEWNALSKEQKEALYKALEGDEAVHNDHGDSQGEGILEDLWNSAVNGFYGILGGGGDQWGYVDSQGKYHRRTCFVAGTLVVTEDGFRPIEEIKAGDVVLSWNEESGKLGYNKVAQTFVRTTELIYQITYEDGTFLETTWNHPFYIKGRGWVKAKDLRDGDLSFTSSSIRGDSRELKVTSVFVDEREERVYNFEVREDHTYFVTGMGVLVHNNTSGYGMSMREIKKGLYELIPEYFIKKSNEDEKNYSVGELQEGDLYKLVQGQLAEVILDLGLPGTEKLIEEKLREEYKEKKKNLIAGTPPIGPGGVTSIFKMKSFMTVVRNIHRPKARKLFLKLVKQYGIQNVKSGEEAAGQIANNFKGNKKFIVEEVDRDTFIIRITTKTNAGDIKIMGHVRGGTDDVLLIEEFQIQSVKAYGRSAKEFAGSWGREEMTKATQEFVNLTGYKKVIIQGGERAGRGNRIPLPRAYTKTD